MQTQAPLLRLRSPLVALSVTGVFLAFMLVPRVHESPSLAPIFLGVGLCLATWCLLLWATPSRRRQGFAIELVPPLKAHYVQTCVQVCIYAYWGWYWREVYAEAPLILSQVVFLYAVDALLSWSRGRSWRLGLGPLPIILSTNLFLWFRDDWFYLQFLMIASCALGKEFLRWQRGGRKTHIFNPSAFGLGLFSIALIATGTTTELTWGVEVATTLALPPYIYVLIFVLGLVVQYLFAVTLMTLSAVASLVLLNLAYTGTTGAFHFVDTNIPIAVFLGLHLLMTDPSTSPATNPGRVVFGVLYGVGSFVLYSVLRDLGAPEFYDKLLTVPILNLSVQLIDRLSAAGPLAWLDRWQARFRPHALNLATMGCWSALFVGLLGVGYVQAPHPGASIEFWEEAAAEGKPRAGENLVKLLGSHASQGSAEAHSHLARIFAEGKLVERDEIAATSHYAAACDLGDRRGCVNLVERFLAVDGAQPGELVLRALAMLEQGCGEASGGRICYLVGVAYEAGRGRAQDIDRALELYREGCARGNPEACKALVRLSRGQVGDTDLQWARPALERACQRGDAQACLHLAYLLHAASDWSTSDPEARSLLERACDLALEPACAALADADPWAAVHSVLFRR